MMTALIWSGCWFICYGNLSFTVCHKAFRMSYFVRYIAWETYDSFSFFCWMIGSFTNMGFEVRLCGLQDGKLVQKMYIFKTEIGKVGSRLLSKVRFHFVSWLSSCTTRIISKCIRHLQIGSLVLWTNGKSILVLSLSHLISGTFPC